jgi:hypothetical protein
MSLLRFGSFNYKGLANLEFQGFLELLGSSGKAQQREAVPPVRSSGRRSRCTMGHLHRPAWEARFLNEMSKLTWPGRIGSGMRPKLLVMRPRLRADWSRGRMAMMEACLLEGISPQEYWEREAQKPPLKEPMIRRLLALKMGWPRTEREHFKTGLRPCAQ